jgi:cob(I)alamin adenosyltransferase
MVKIYTRTGDNGETSLLAGRRVRKSDLRIEAIGSIDECNATLGVVRMELTRSGVAPEALDELLAQVQHRLFDIGAELAMPPSALPSTGTLSAADVAALERAIDGHEATLAPLRSFILPGGSASAAQLHLARCVCRRAERRLVELADSEPVREELLGYLNRLGDLLFVLARVANQANRMPDVLWQHGAGAGAMGREEK